MKTLRVCACGCGLPAPKYYRHGVFKTYVKYIKGHYTPPAPSEKQLQALAVFRKANWENPEYRAKMSRVSSETMSRTNDGKAQGLYPNWEARHREWSKLSMKSRWDSGKQPIAINQRHGKFRSRLEVRFVLLLEYLNIEWEYEPKLLKIVLDGKVRHCLPDFYLPELDHWIELKGFWREISRRKSEALIAQNPTLKYSVLDSEMKRILGSASPVPSVVTNFVCEKHGIFDKPQPLYQLNERARCPVCKKMSLRPEVDILLLQKMFGFDIFHTRNRKFKKPDMKINSYLPNTADAPLGILLQKV